MRSLHVAKCACLLLFAMTPIALRAQFNYWTNYTYITNNGTIITNGTITITGYTGPGGGVTIPDTISGFPVTCIAQNAFLGCLSLTNLAFGTNVGYIGAFSFDNCSNLTSVAMPNSVTNIGNWAFENCSNLTSATIPNSVIIIGSGAFFGCHGLTSITIPNSVTTIGDNAFGCYSLTNVMIGRSVTNIGVGAFGGYNFTEITVDTNNPAYSSLGGVLFNKTQTTLVECPSGTSAYTIPDSVTNIGVGAFGGCYRLTTLTIPNNVVSIGDQAFLGCSLTNIIIGTNVTSIGMDAFFSDSLTSVTIPNSVTNIGNQAFGFCTGLSGVYFQGNAPSIGSYIFNLDHKLTVYYLLGTTGWSDFATNAHVPIALWLPQMQTNGANFGVQGGEFGFNVNWSSGQTVVVEACTNLADGPWIPLQTNIITSGLFYFSDPQWPNYASRFYRIRSP